MNAAKIVLILAFLLSSAALAQNALKVGALGDTAAIAFEGNAHFTDDELRAGLRQHPACVVASHPDAPRQAYVTQIADALARGYRKYGFQTASVNAAVNVAGDGILVQIEEGQQLRNGPVVVKGVDDHLAGALRERLQVGKTDADGHNDAVWVQGQPSNFENSPRIRRMVTEELREQGWLTADSHVELEADAEVVTLNVIVDDLGVESVVGAITVEGAERHRDAQIVEFLGLAEGAKIDGGVLAESRTRLYDSGRFIQQTITMKRRRPEGAVVDLTITIEESPDVPLLSEPFPRYAEALLKGSKWLAGFQSSPHDIVLAGASEGAAVDLALSPKNGLLLALRFPQSSAKTDVVLLLSTTQVLLKTSGVEGVWRYDLSLPVEARIGLRATGDHEQRFRFIAEARTRNNQGAGNTFPLKISIDPVAIAIGLKDFAEMAEDLEWNGDVMSLEVEGTGFSFDAASGRLLNAFAKDDELDVTLRTEAGGYLRLYDAYIGDDATKNHYAADAPLSSSVSFLMNALPPLLKQLRTLADDDELPSEEEVEEIAAVARILLDLGLLKPFDEVVKKITKGTGQLFTSRFRIPNSGGPMHENPTMLLMAQLLSAVLDVLPRGSWADRFSREMVHVAHGNTSYTDKVLESLYADTANIGPVGYLIMAKMIGFLNPKLAARFAGQGLQQLSAENFAKDWRLLASDPAMESAFLDFVSALPTIDDERRATLDGTFGEGATDELIELIGKGDSKEGEAFADFMSPLMADLWTDSLQEPLRAQFQKLAGPPVEKPRIIARVNGVPVPHTALIPWSDGRTPEQAVQIAIITEVVHQHYVEELSKDQPTLLEQILTQSKPQMNMLMGAGMPAEVAMKALLYQYLMQRTIQGVPPASQAEAQAYYTLHRADIGRPFADVADDLVRHLTQMRGMKLVERWLNRLRDKADIKLGPPESQLESLPQYRHPESRR
jgi:hypothetical protein